MLAEGAYCVGQLVELGNSGTCLPLPAGDDLFYVLFSYSSVLDKVLTKCLMCGAGRSLSQDWEQDWERRYWWMLAPTFRMELGPHISWAA